MDIEVSRMNDDVTVARLSGRMDSAGVDKAESRFSAAVVAPGRHTAVDLSNVSFLASMGIRLFITSARALNLKGGKMVLFGAPELVQIVLDHVALDQIIPIVQTEAQAIDTLRA
jgi:anti-sigma B factor antagonist